MNCIEVQKKDAAAIRWLYDGINKDGGRPVMQGLCVEDDITVAANGYQLRIAPTPESLKEFDGKLVRLDKAPRAGGDVVKTSLIDEDKFPEWREIIPTGKPAFQIGVNAGWLANLIMGMGETVELIFYSPTQPIIIKSDDKYAVLMPTYTKDVERFDPINPPELKESNQNDKSS